MTESYIALGSNLGNPLQQVEAAIEVLRNQPDWAVCAVSSWYVSAAVGPGQQPDYVNGVACLQSELAASDILDRLLKIETSQGRVRTERWGARTLDLDLLVHGQDQISEPNLQVPHPRMHERRFVLEPLAEIAPNLTLPCGTTIESLLARCSGGEVRLLHRDGTNRQTPGTASESS